MTALHYAAEYPSLSVIMELLSLRNLNALAFDNCLRTPSRLIPLSHLTSMKSLLLHEKEQMLKHFFSSIDTFADNLVKIDLENKHFHLDIPAEKSALFDLDGSDHQPSTQRPRSIPIKGSLLLKAKAPSERMIGKSPSLTESRRFEAEINFKKKGERPLQKLSSFHLPMSLSKLPIPKTMLSKRPLRLTLQTTPALQLNDLHSFKKLSINKDKVLEKLADRISTVNYDDQNLKDFKRDCDNISHSLKSKLIKEKIHLHNFIRLATVQYRKCYAGLKGYELMAGSPFNPSPMSECFTSFTLALEAVTESSLMLMKTTTDHFMIDKLLILVKSLMLVMASIDCFKATYKARLNQFLKSFSETSRSSLGNLSAAKDYHIPYLNQESRHLRSRSKDLVNQFETIKNYHLEHNAWSTNQSSNFD